MIHQHIFASPKPGMTEEEFHRYWLNVHAIQYASKIKQIRRYMIDTRVPCRGVTDPPKWNGIAEIWLENEEEQLASLQSKEFLEGARIDEPRWAAFWNTLVLDTDAHVVLDGPPQTKSPAWVKLVVLLKRKWGMPVEEFRSRLADSYAPLLTSVEGLRRYLQCTTRDSWYAGGEPRFDGLHQLWFDSVGALELALRSANYVHAQAHLAEIVETRYLFSMATEEHWIVGPEARGREKMADCEANAQSSPNSCASSNGIPWESRERNGGQAIAEQLRVAGLVGNPDNVIIGNPGSGEEWLYLELNDEIRMGLAEAAVGSIVDGAGRLRSKPAVAIAHGFVGFSGLQGDVFNAAQRQSPMLVIVGTSDSQAHTGETHMYADVEGAAKAARAKYVKDASDPETLLRDLRDAIIQASIPPFGPVVFIVGSNVTSAPNTEQVLAPKLPDTRLAPPDSSLEPLADALLGAQKPSILIGDGVARSDAQYELQEVVELLGAEVWASMESEVNLPRHHPAFQGNLGHMDDSRGRELLKDVDFALAVGTPVYQTVFNSKLPLFRPGAEIATINPDPETSLRGHNDVTFPVKGDPKRVLEILANVLKRKRTNAQTERAEARIREMRLRKEEALKQRRENALAQPGVTMGKFGHLLERRMLELPVRPVIFNEALVGAAGLTDHIENANLPGMYFDTSGGALGEWAGAVGAAMTGSPTIAIIGDGGFHYALQVVWNAAHERLRLGLVVANNDGYGLLYANMDAALRARGIDIDSVPRRHYYEIPSVDYVKVAEGYGVPGMRVEREEQMDEAIGTMLNSQGPFLIDLVQTNP